MSIAAATISTHSRAKAAGLDIVNHAICIVNFNSQPREGGWADEVLEPLPAH